jgi:bifunctional NMN adenylyltransferase/nudix hydrolase
MNNKTERFPYIWSLFILRGQGFHLGHLHNINEALKISKFLIILLGSHNKAIDFDDPWTVEQRREMIEASLTEDQKTRIYFQYIEDRLYSNSTWIAMAQEKVDSILLQYSRYRLNAIDKNKQVKMCIIGHSKDESSWYLKAFPHLDLVELPKFNIFESDGPINATDIRHYIYENKFGHAKALMPSGTYNWIIKNWINTPDAKYVKDWYDFEMKYEEPYLTQPYAVNFYTADAVVIHSGHVLLGRRKNFPGKDYWAIIGGHVNANETAQEASVRELYEETKIRISPLELQKCLKFEKLFDHPKRSKRCCMRTKKGRTISMTYCYVLDNELQLPYIEADDDIAEVKWVPFSDIKNMRNVLFEDHADILDYCINHIN